MVEGGGTALREAGTMTASYFRELACRCRTASRDCFDLFAKEEFRRLAAEFNAKAKELDFSTKNPGRIGWWMSPPHPARSVDR
jgi:hypothetical protein